MIINSTPQNEAIVSNVKDIGEFRIRNSAKAFSILSSGLYANKIRAVIRELSCNAIDSHVAAGKKDTPFDVHLPNQLEPWFSVRDYGVGLSHDQVINIYTTYFESTKTASNEFIGGLGLGSKSPFAYVDNFTVTAVKDGTRGIYTAFINEHGVPSIALMTQSDTTEHNGVEVKFAVTSSTDFHKFEHEAGYVYRYFDHKPVVTGAHQFKFIPYEYHEKDVIPGLHYRKHLGSSVAVMGNVPYPIDVPNPAENLGELSYLLALGLEMHFDIGELDFQASREGLSYIPSTIAAIKRKLTELNAVLLTKLTSEANAIKNIWDRQVFLKEKFNLTLWRSTVIQYVKTTSFPLLRVPPFGKYIEDAVQTFTEEELATKFNIKLSGFSKSPFNAACTSTRPDVVSCTSMPGGPCGPSGSLKVSQWRVFLSPGMRLVVNDTSIGVLERAKYHWRRRDQNQSTRSSATESVYVLTKADATKEINLKGFLKALHNLPSKYVMLASALDQKPRASAIARAATGPVSILKLHERSQWRRGASLTVWRPAGDLASMDQSRTYYYLPVVGFDTYSSVRTESGKPVKLDMSTIDRALDNACLPGLTNISIYGVRKADLANVQAKKNWVNLENAIIDALGKLDDSFWKNVWYSEVNSFAFLQYNANIKNHVPHDSEFMKVYSFFEGVTNKHADAGEILHGVSVLSKMYTPTVSIDSQSVRGKYRDECQKIIDRYPLLASLPRNTDPKAVGEYITLLDSIKKCEVTVPNA